MILNKVKFSGKDYPKPIINHYEATVKNLARMKSFRASQQNTVKLTSGILIVLIFIDKIYTSVYCLSCKYHKFKHSLNSNTFFIFYLYYFQILDVFY